MKWIGNRISFVDQRTKTTIVVDPEKNVWINAIMGSWLAMWYAIGGTVFWALNVMPLKEQEVIILWVFVVFWCYYAFRVSKTFLWIMFGQEFIKIDDRAFHLKKSILSYGKSYPYYFDNIKNMTYEIPKQGSFQSIWESSPWINGGERFSFDYFQKKISFGRKLSEKEAKLLSQLITKNIQERAKN